MLQQGLEIQEAFAQLDLILCLGGDGTLMFCASKFQKMENPVPPMLAFGLGSLGFLTPFNHSEFEVCAAALYGRSYLEPCAAAITWHQSAADICLGLAGP